MAGKTYTDYDLTVWRGRVTSGYSPNISGMPDQWGVIQSQAALFVNNPSSEYVTDIVNIQQSNKGHKLVCAAFKYLMDGSNSTTIHNHIINQVQESTLDYTQYMGGGFVDNLIFSSFLVVKIYQAYDYCRDLFSTSEKAIIDAWLYDAGVFFMGRDMVGTIEGVIPKRNADDNYDTTAALLADQGSHVLNEWYYVIETNKNYQYNGTATGSLNDYTLKNTAKRDYSSFTGVGANNDLFSPTKHTHVDSSGVLQNEIAQFNAFWNNTRAGAIRAVAFIGVELGDSLMIDHARLFYEETLKYHTFPDGTIAEYRRNGNYGYVQQGSAVYGIINIETLIVIADLLLNNGYGNMFDYTTSNGRLNSVGGSKNLRLLIETLIENCENEYLDVGSRYYSSVSEANLLDSTDDATNRRFLPELILSLANRHYKEQRIEDAYMLTLAGSDPYLGALIIGDHPWGGALQAIASSGFQYHETVGNIYPTANAGSDQSISVATTTLDGTGSYDTDGTISSYLWEQVSGPNTANILTPSGSSSIVNGLIVGDYIFRLTITDDGLLTDTDEVTITVNPVISTNKANARVLL